MGGAWAQVYRVLLDHEAVVDVAFPAVLLDDCAVQKRVELEIYVQPWRIVSGTADAWRRWTGQRRRGFDIIALPGHERGGIGCCHGVIVADGPGAPRPAMRHRVHRRGVELFFSWRERPTIPPPSSQFIGFETQCCCTQCRAYKKDSTSKSLEVGGGSGCHRVTAGRAGIDGSREGPRFIKYKGAVTGPMRRTQPPGSCYHWGTSRKMDGERPIEGGQHAGNLTAWMKAY